MLTSLSVAAPHALTLRLQDLTPSFVFCRFPAIMGKKIPPRMRGQIEYFTSPYEQNLFGDIFDARLMMTKMRRKLGFVKDFGPGLVLFAAVYNWGNSDHERRAHEHRY
jgi:UcrQ family